MTKILYLSLYSAILFSFLNCKKPESSETVNIKESSEQKEPKKSEDKIVKQQAYVKCLNATFQSYTHVLSGYFRWCTGACEKNGPSGKEAGFYQGVGEIVTEPRVCIEQMRKTASQMPATPDMDQAALKYASALEKLYPVIQSAHLYYTHEDYKSDGFKKAKELHQDLTNQGNALLAAGDALGEGIDRIEDEMFQEDMKSMSSGSMHYMLLDFVIATKQLNRWVDKLHWNESLSTPIIQQIKQQANVTVEKWKLLDSYYTMNKSKAASELDRFSPGLWLIISYAEAYKATVAKFMTILEKPNSQKINNSDSNIGNELHKHYSEFVRELNKLKFKK